MDFQFTVKNGKLRLLNFLSNCSLSLGSFISLVSPSVSRPQVSTQMWFWVLSKKEVLAWAQLAHVLTRLNISKVNTGFDPWIGKIPWRRAWQPTPVFLPGESHGQEPDRLQSMGSQESDMT